MGKTKPWKVTDLNYLKMNYSKKPVSEIATELGRTENAIRLKASRSGLKRPFILLEDTQAQTVLKCYGRDFDQDCVDQCPVWYPCLDLWIEKQKKFIEYDKESNTVRIKGHVVTGQIIEVIRARGLSENGQ